VIVVDASVVVDLLIRPADVSRIEERLFDRDDTLHAPHLLDVEVAQVLRRFESRGALTVDHARAAIDLVARFPIHRYAHEPLLALIWSLRANLTAYDAAYVALAEGLRATLVTRDRRLASAPGLRAAIEVI
jgi:predicted nucleic acid-binding protein